MLYTKLLFISRGNADEQSQKNEIKSFLLDHRVYIFMTHRTPRQGNFMGFGLKMFYHVLLVEL